MQKSYAVVANKPQSIMSPCEYTNPRAPDSHYRPSLVRAIVAPCHRTVASHPTQTNDATTP